MTDRELSSELAEYLDGQDDVCLGPTDIALVVRALRLLALKLVTVTDCAEPEAA